MKTPEYQKALKAKPDIVLIMLGTNDAREQQHEEEFDNCYKHLVKSFMELESQPKVYIMVPVPVYKYENCCNVN